MEELSLKIHSASEYVESKLEGRKPYAGIVLGSGLGKLADMISNRIVIPYKDIPGFPISTAIGHKGNFICGELGGKCVIAMQGRFHNYEGYQTSLAAMPIRVMKLLGIEFLFVSNAAGAINQSYKVGDLVIIKDHINLLPNPLIGRNLDEFGPRFPDMTCAYDIELQDLACRIGREMGLNFNKGVYLGNPGPSYETPAEVRFYKIIGADIVGMSTIPEVIVARHCGIRVFGMSVITNVSNTDNTAKILNDGDDVVKQADMAATRMTELFSRIISAI